MSQHTAGRLVDGRLCRTSEQLGSCQEEQLTQLSEAIEFAHKFEFAPEQLLVCMLPIR
jgi:hypothetical protein